MTPFRFLSAAALFLCVQAHMEMISPPPFRSKDNTNVPSGKADYSMTSPLDPTLFPFPCRGYLKDLTDSTGLGKSVASWPAGSSQAAEISGGADHSGGSCQYSLSTDQGTTFKVIKSYIGACPVAPNSNFTFTVPSDAPVGDAVFAWTWYNKIGNREIYMNCAAVTITAGSGAAPAVAFSALPNIFEANIQNGCVTIETVNVNFPNPGPDVTGSTTGPAGYSGTCQVAAGGSSGSSGSAAASPVAATSSGKATVIATSVLSSAVVSIPVVPTTTAVASPSGGVFVTVSSSGTATAKSSAATSQSAVTSTKAATSLPATSTLATSVKPSTPISSGSATSGSLTISSDGSCGGTTKCGPGYCCSAAGFCGAGDAWCGTGCQSSFGSCGVNGTAVAIRGRNPSMQHWRKNLIPDSHVHKRHVVVGGWGGRH